MKRSESSHSLKKWFDNKPRTERGLAVREFAAAHQISERTAYNYITNHPVSCKSMGITERFTSNQVTRFDIAPEVYDRNELIQLLERVV